MKLLNQKEFLSIISLDINSFPFCFQAKYLEAYPQIHILQLNDSFSAIKISKNKFIKYIQFEFPPINTNGTRLSNDDEKIFCQEAIKYISYNKLAHRIVQPKNYCLFSVAPANTVFSKFGSYIINLANKTETQLIDGMQARYRSAIRQIEKLKVEIKFGIGELESFQKLHAETMERTGAYFEKKASLIQELEALPDNTLLATIYINNNIQGGVYLMYSKYSAFYFHGASANTTEASGAIKYLHYKLMCLMKTKGVKEYDFVGARLSDITNTKLEGIQNFKKRFGSELIKGFLWKLDIDKGKCKTYDSLLKIKCKLKGTKFPKDIIDQELSKAVN